MMARKWTTPADHHLRGNWDQEHNGSASLLGSPGLDRGPLVGHGVCCSLLFAALPFVPVKESAITGAVLCGFAVGWAMLWLLSLRFTDQPQRWAVAPALFMGVGGLLLVAFGSPMREALSWVWPPTLFLLVIWMLHQTRRHMRSRSGRVQLYLVFAILAISAVGGGYETVLEATDSTALPATGRLIDVGGHKLYLNCVGSGSPTVVLEPGAGGDVLANGLDHPGRGTQYPRVRLRPCRSWLERDRRQPSGRRTDSHRPAHLAAPRRRHRAVCPGRALLRWPVRPHLRCALPRRGCGPGPRGLHGVEGTREVRHSIDRRSATGQPSPRPGVALGSRRPAPRDWAAGFRVRFPPQSRDEARASIAQASWLRSTVDEYLRAGASTQEAASLRDFADKPLFVLTAGQDTRLPGWRRRTRC